MHEYGALTVLGAVDSKGRRQPLADLGMEQGRGKLRVSPKICQASAAIHGVGGLDAHTCLNCGVDGAVREVLAALRRCAHGFGKGLFALQTGKNFIFHSFKRRGGCGFRLEHASHHISVSGFKRPVHR